MENELLPGSMDEIPIIWIDDALLVVDKPTGLSVLPDGWQPQKPFVKELLEKRYGKLWVVHRLDHGTSGVLIFGRTPDAHRELNRQFENREVRKIYHAIVVGNPGWETKEVFLPLRVNVGHHHRTAVDAQHGKPSSTSLRVLERFEHFSLLEAEPHTGRTHQIRVHLNQMQFPVAGDRLYTPQRLTKQGEENLPERENNLPDELINRVFLHAWTLAVKHPLTGEICQYQAAYPFDFNLLINYLRTNQA